MSPSESDLRRALHDGEHDGGVDVQRIMAAGERRRAQRRARIGTGLSVGALVAVVVSGGVLLAHNGGSDDSGGSSGAQLDRRAGGSEAGGGKAAAPAASSAGSAHSSSAASTPATSACPTDFPRLVLPGGGGTGQFGAGGKLFAAPVATITVCAYGPATGSGRNTGRVVLRDALARTLATSLENATKGEPSCPMTTGRRVTRQFALLPVTAAGRALRAVTVELDTGGCPNHVSNGTASRSLWQPPSGLDGIFAALERGSTGATGSTSPGVLRGSPVRS